MAFGHPRALARCARHPPGLPGVTSADHAHAQTRGRDPSGRGNRVSFAGWRCISETRDSDLSRPAESRVPSVALDAVSMAAESASLKSVTPGNPGGLRALRAGARAGRRSLRSERERARGLGELGTGEWVPRSGHFQATSRSADSDR